MNIPLSPEWTKFLGLSYRKPPEFYQSPDEVIDVPHAGVIRDAFTKLGLSAIFCVQGVPTIAILIQKEYDRKTVIKVHAALWNQGLASLLLVISDNTIRAFSLARRTIWGSEEEFQTRCLINDVANSLALKELVYGVESGRLWKEHSKFFPTQERIDSVLLGNLRESYRQLCNKGLSSDASQALLVQTMFISYLEDREIITKQYILESTGNKANDFNSILESGNTKSLKQLFKTLRQDFNGDLFIAPCSFEVSKNTPPLDKKHLLVLARFHSGKEEMMEKGSQLRFWGYNFKYIPIELISAVYDRFLSEEDEERRKLGAYYTPMFLADTVVSQAWDTLTPAIKENGTFLDPACGSGIFLVRLFQRLCEQWRVTHPNQTIRWASLCKLIKRIHGWDINRSAVRIAVFSLYIALLEQVSPPDFRILLKKGRILPELWRETLIEQDFFSVPEERQSHDVIIGNPPWTSRRISQHESVKWCNQHSLPMPSGETAWGFAWKALTHLTPQGLVVFLLPAMGFLHNHSSGAVVARNQFIQKAQLLQVINFADLRFQLFDGANRPAALILFQKTKHDYKPYKFEYWMPKADLNLRLKRFITLSSVDKTWLRSDELQKDQLSFKRRLWMRGPDAKLFNYLNSFPKLNDFIITHKKRHEHTETGWFMGEGFKQAVPKRIGEENYNVSESSVIQKYPFLSIEQFRGPVLHLTKEKPWPTKLVHRKGFEEGFCGPRILISRGVRGMRLCASYTEQSLTFFSIIKAITIPKERKDQGKLLTALLNSRIAIWFAFHGTASFAADRPEVQQAEFLRLPFPNIEDLPEPKRAEKAAQDLVKIIDELLSKRDELLISADYELQNLSEIDTLAYDYFCLSEDEISIIEDTANYIIPAIQPHKGALPSLWKTAQAKDRTVYAEALDKAVREWLSDDSVVNISFVAGNMDLGILRLSLVQADNPRPYQEHTNNSFEDVLGKLWEHVKIPLIGNFQLLPDFRIFIGSDLYLIKPMQKRFWLRSTALADADEIAADLQDALTLNNKAGRGK